MSRWMCCVGRTRSPVEAHPTDYRERVAKLILALRGAQETSWLFESDLRDSLARVGVTAFQVNLDDEVVEDALRMDPGEPVTALASLWTEGDLRAALDVVAAAAANPEFDAYRVTERIRLDPRPVADGVRADVVAQIALLRRPHSLTREEYLDIWLLDHTPVAIRTQNTTAYIQNIVEETLTPSSPPVAAIVEEHFPMASLNDPHELYGSRGDDAELERRMTELLDSVVRFGAHRGLDLVPTSQYRWALG
jgi:hypothetical protein